MDMKDILEQIERRLDELKLKPATVSREATGSTDTIRNWQRAVKDGNEPGGTVKSLLAIADALGLELRVMTSAGQSLFASEPKPSPKPAPTENQMIVRLWELFDRVRKADSDVQLQVIRLIESTLGPGQAPAREAKSRATKTKPAS